MFFVGIIVAFVYNWELTLVILSTYPAMIISGAMFNKLLIQGSATSTKLYAAAGSIADEALSLIRTVVSFGTQDLETTR
jgi:ATP-binding cassette, subfamily B (MDR/TAP), member 1